MSRSKYCYGIERHGHLFVFGTIKADSKKSAWKKLMRTSGSVLVKSFYVMRRVR